MAIYRRNKEKNFSIVDLNILKSDEMSIKAKWLLLTALSMPDDWVFNIRGLSRFCMEGPDMVRFAVKELEGKGHIVRRRKRANGKYKEMEYDIFEDPKMNKDFTAKAVPAQEKPLQVESRQAKTAQGSSDIHNINIPNINLPNINFTNNPSIHQDLMMENQIRKQIEYDILCERYDNRLLSDLVSVMVNVMMIQSESIAVSKDNVYPASYVQKCISKLNPLHIEQIMESMTVNQPVIRNVRGYLLTALINAANTMDTGYQYGDY